MMAARALQKQEEYARLLNAQWGYPILVPSPEPRVGDVAYFVGSGYARLLNVFDLDEGVFRANIAQEILTTQTAEVFGVSRLDENEPHQHPENRIVERTTWSQVSRGVTVKCQAEAGDKCLND